MKTILVTGANGFIGKALYESLAKSGHIVRGVVRDVQHFNNRNREFTNVTFFTIMKETDWEWALNDVDTVVHLAGRVHQMREKAKDSLLENLKINRDLTMQLAERCLKAGIKKFIFASTVKVMGESGRSTKPLTEDDTFAPEDPYGISKKEAEQGLNELFKGQSASRAVTFRFPMVYGPGNKGNMLTLLKMASKSIPLPLGAVQAKRSMIYIGNVWDAIKKIIDDSDELRPSVGTYFITDGRDFSSKELYSLISVAYHGRKSVFYLPTAILRLGGVVGSLVEKTAGVRLPLNRDVASRLLDEYRFSPAAFSSDYGWIPPFTTETGISETVEWYKTVQARTG